MIRFHAKKLKDIHPKCKSSQTIFFIVVLRYLFTKLRYGTSLFLHQHVSINGIQNIRTNHNLEIGISYVGFKSTKDPTYLNIQGKLILNGNFSIGRGCRFDIGKNAIITIGSGSYINPDTTLIIMNHLSIGDNCSISWNCQFLDEDFHVIEYPGIKNKESKAINVGNNVWIGCGVKIYKGASIPHGCIVASDSVIKKRFMKENCLIGGNPAKVLKENVQWK